MKTHKTVLYTGLIASSLFLSSCSLITPYTAPVQQGKIIPQDIMQQIKPGMSKQQIEYILGTPDIVDPLTPNQWRYIYSMQKELNAPRQEKQLILIFDKKDKLTSVSGDYSPPKTIYQNQNDAQSQSDTQDQTQG
ncbi:outer membrane protein assembly factor BamE [Facilibium subflavum]|uniref:outer membrane protein assembly factor BamE n=1 Tax=Facilibium subflavum TaxID=2219058 RepID=UPI000E64B1B0|nr:outer membrane protein assembly factor BamE [Facilibium subflavum]